jgi:lycopene cyclase domain-containing protein
MPEYTLLTVVALVAVVTLDLVVVRTRLLATITFWITTTIVLSFQVLVDGWLTKLSAPIVLYDEAQFSSVRVGFDSPLEDFGFGFAMVLATLMVWEVVGRQLRRTHGPRLVDVDHQPPSRRSRSPGSEPDPDRRC